MPVSCTWLTGIFHRSNVSFKILRTVGAATRFRVAFLRLLPHFRIDMVTVSARAVSMVATTAVSAVGNDAGARFLPVSHAVTAIKAVMTAARAISPRFSLDVNDIV